MDLKTLNWLFRTCLLGLVIGVPVIFFNKVAGTVVIAIAVISLSILGWKTWKLFRVNPDVLKEYSGGRKEVSLRDLPSWLAVLLLVLLIIGFLGELGVFNSDPFVNTVLSVTTVYLLIYYFLYKHKIGLKTQF